MKILVTGGTGFIGKRLVSSLESVGHEILCLTRPKSINLAKETFKNKNIKIIKGDITDLNAYTFMSELAPDLESIDMIIHLAAVYDLEVGLAIAHNTNVLGTQNMLELSKLCKNLKSFHHISTYAVNGPKEKRILENDLFEKTTFPDFYSQTKNEAERHVRNFKFNNDVLARVYRPCIIVGDSDTGEMDKIDGPYYFFNLFSKLSRINKLIPLKGVPISCHKKTLLPILPVNVLVDWMTKMILNPTKESFQTYHLMPPEKIFLTDFVESVLKEFGMKSKVLRIGFPKIYAKILPLLKIPRELIPYMQAKSEYLSINFQKDYPELTAPNYKSYLSKISGPSKL